MNIAILIERARKAQGSYEPIAKFLGMSEKRLSDWKAGRRKPDAFEICYLAEIAGLNPLDTLAKVQAEIDSERSSYWLNWCARRDSNPRPLPSEGSTLSS